LHQSDRKEYAQAFESGAISHRPNDPFGRKARKRAAPPKMGFKSFRSAAASLAGVELMHMIRKGQLRARVKLRRAPQFYALAG
jgi:transposase-like protein